MCGHLHCSGDTPDLCWCQCTLLIDHRCRCGCHCRAPPVYSIFSLPPTPPRCCPQCWCWGCWPPSPPVTGSWWCRLHGLRSRGSPVRIVDFCSFASHTSRHNVGWCTGLSPATRCQDLGLGAPACMWFTNYTFVSGEPSLPPHMRTYQDLEFNGTKYDWTKVRRTFHFHPLLMDEAKDFTYIFNYLITYFLIL